MIMVEGQMTRGGLINKPPALQSKAAQAKRKRKDGMEIKNACQQGSDVRYSARYEEEIRPSQPTKSRILCRFHFVFRERSIGRRIQNHVVVGCAL